MNKTKERQQLAELPRLNQRNITTLEGAVLKLQKEVEALRTENQTIKGLMVTRQNEMDGLRQIFGKAIATVRGAGPTEL